MYVILTEVFFISSLNCVLKFMSMRHPVIESSLFVFYGVLLQMFFMVDL